MVRVIIVVLLLTGSVVAFQSSTEVEQEVHKIWLEVLSGKRSTDGLFSSTAEGQERRRKFENWLKQPKEIKYVLVNQSVERDERMFMIWTLAKTNFGGEVVSFHYLAGDSFFDDSKYYVRKFKTYELAVQKFTELHGIPVERLR